MPGGELLGPLSHASLPPLRFWCVAQVLLLCTRGPCGVGPWAVLSVPGGAHAGLRRHCGRSL
eukprot:10744554-Alexandrium_andersonii.AAC.1